MDGWDVPANGSQVGHDGAPFAEQTIVHGGRQSMPLKYDNSTAAYSEATRTFDDPQDWTQFGVKGLVLWFYGDPANTAGQMYVKVNGKKVAYDGDADNILRKPWQMWYIDLAGFTGVNLKKVTELTIGLEGGHGHCVHRRHRIVAAGSPVGDARPARRDGPRGPLRRSRATPTTAREHVNGTVDRRPTYVAGKVGQAIKLDGARDYVLVESTFELPVYSAALWFRVDGGSGERDLLSIYDSAGNHGVLVEVRANSALRFLHRAPVADQGGSRCLQQLHVHRRRLVPCGDRQIGRCHDAVCQRRAGRLDGEHDAVRPGPPEDGAGRSEA